MYVCFFFILTEWTESCIGANLLSALLLTLQTLHLAATVFDGVLRKRAGRVTKKRCEDCQGLGHSLLVSSDVKKKKKAFYAVSFETRAVVEYQNRYFVMHNCLFSSGHIDDDINNYSNDLHNCLCRFCSRFQNFTRYLITLTGKNNAVKCNKVRYCTLSLQIIQTMLSYLHSP